MIGKRLRALMSEREDLLERWKQRNEAERAKILVQLIDLDEDIDRISREEHEKASGE